jgi:hypothetical protein
MLAVSSPKPCRRRRIQRGISAPQASEKRISCVELVMGMMPGTTGTVDAQCGGSSTKRK